MNNRTKSGKLCADFFFIIIQCCEKVFLDRHAIIQIQYLVNQLPQTMVGYTV